MRYHLIIKSPFGYCAIIFTKNPFTLKQVLLPQQNLKNILSELKTKQTTEEKKDKNGNKIASAIKNYFNNQIPIKIDWNILDLEMSPFYEKALLKTAEIPFSEVCSYKDIAVKAGSPKASRAVGNALAANPFPIIIPCHRVIKSDRKIGKFGGGSQLKAKMINMERKAKELPPLY